MTILFDYNNIWKAKGFSRDGHTLEATIRWMNKSAGQHGIDIEVAAMAIREIMQEVNEGKEFSLDKCPCGCGIDKSGTAINHAMRDRMFEIDREVQLTAVRLMEDRHNKAILAHINEENERYVAQMLPPKNGNGSVVNGLIVFTKIAAIFGVLAFAGYMGW